MNTIKNTATLDINIDHYNNICLVMDGMRYQVDKDKLKELCKPILPTSFDEVDKEYDLHRCCIEAYAPYTSQLATLSQLLYLRDIYRQGWKPDWTNNDVKYAISNQNDELIKVGNTASNRIFAFQSSEVRDKFYINFKEMLEKIKDLI